MAKLPALVTALAEIDGRERKTIDYIARTIRERDYITTEKRGSGAADMTVREAVNLLIALNGADLPKDAPLAIDRYRSLVQRFSGNAKKISDRLDRVNWMPESVQHVADARTFGEAMERLIEYVPDLFRTFHEGTRKTYDYLPEKVFNKSIMDVIKHRLLGPEVTFQGSSAKIEFFETLVDPSNTSAYDGDNTRSSRLVINYKPDRARGSDFYGIDHEYLANPTDRYVSIGFATLMRVYGVLHKENDK
ncbi:hypothetical protein CN235_18040 [Sinorhizobium meliloti]|uniref:hypothetical protein n=1 Tax=Rhizobium meliloti TaxID=382 RepID=UPI000FD22CD6|nr:hypothetical protein [Sinorhizobium meliloti]RVE92449.1 hypothetical protein CN235_18040 [Sinorhizobium meliloti]